MRTVAQKRSSREAFPMVCTFPILMEPLGSAAVVMTPGVRGSDPAAVLSSPQRASPPAAQRKEAKHIVHRIHSAQSSSSRTTQRHCSNRT